MPILDRARRCDRESRSGAAPWWLVAILLVGPFTGLIAGPARQTGPASGGVDRRLPQAGAGPPQLTYKVEVDYVEVTARVTDARGRFVGDLLEDDFRVFEDGTPQTITNFSLVNLESQPTPDPPAVWQAVEPDVRSNARPFEGRLYVLLLDDLHVALEQTGDVRRSVRRFLEQYFDDGDMAAVVSTSGSADAAQELTTSRQRLLSAVDRFVGRKGLGTPLVNYEGYVPGTVAGGRQALAEDALSSLRRLAELLGGVHGRRKAVVYVSEGPSFCRVSQRVGVLNQDAAAVAAAATRANVAIYGIDPRGLDPSIADCDLDAGIQSLRGLSDATGGFALVNSNDFDGGFRRIRQENSTYYVLGYYPAERGRDGAFRKIQVRTTRPGLDVQARQGYVVPRRTRPARPAVDPGGASPVLGAALESALPVPGVRLSGMAIPFRGNGAQAAVTVALAVDGRDLSFKPDAGSFVGSLELTLATMNSRGEAGASEHSVVRMPLEAESYAKVAGGGIRIVRSFALKPGRYQLRIGAMDRASKRTGVIHCDLDVPDFRSLSFSMSGLLITSSLAGMVPTAPGGPLEELQKRLPGPPTLSREFRAGEELALYAEVYDRESAPHDVAIVTTVLGENGRDFYRYDTSVGMNSQGPAGRSAGSDRVVITAKVPLQSAPPGRYVLRVEAWSRTGQGRTVRREVPFTILP